MDVPINGPWPTAISSSDQCVVGIAGGCQERMLTN
jgi:hypothetical protein